MLDQERCSKRSWQGEEMKEDDHEDSESVLGKVREHLPAIELEMPAPVSGELHAGTLSPT
jgi:hypothetical protein